MWAFYRILEAVNYIVIGVAAFGFLGQAFFLLLCWLPKKVYPQAAKQHRFAIIIPAHNEAAVIGSTVAFLKHRLVYPTALYDVFVCADSCSDNTAAIARREGAFVIELRHDNPATKKAAYPIKALVDTVLKGHNGKYDAVVRFDADNLCNPEFLSRMNDALDSGVELAKSYENSRNLTQNVWSRVSGTYYIRDSRIPCRVRQALGMDQIMSGAGMMIATKVLAETGGWDAMSAAEDVEFSIRRLLEGRKIKYVEDAVVYEDQPSSFIDTFRRLTRMGNGINRTFWKYAPRLLGRFFITGRLSYLDYLQTMVFIPIAVLSCVWFPLYYIFYVIVNWTQGFVGLNLGLFPGPEWIALARDQIYSLGTIIGLFLISYFVVFAGQTFLAVWADHRKLGLKWTCKGTLSGILTSPAFMIVYAIAITFGVMTKPKWASQKRNIQPADVPEKAAERK